MEYGPYRVMTSRISKAPTTRSWIASDLVNDLRAGASLLGHVRGGLSYVLIGAMYLVSGISGSKVPNTLVS